MMIQAGGERGENAIDAGFLRRDLEGPFVNLFFTRDGDVFSVHLTNTKMAGQDVSGDTTLAFAPEDGLVLAPRDPADD